MRYCLLLIGHSAECHYSGLRMGWSMSLLCNFLIICRSIDDVIWDCLTPVLPLSCRLPRFHLLHGDSDYIVPFSSSVRFGEALWDRGIRGVEVVVLPGCSHYDICLDLMDARRQWHNSLMTELRRSISSNVV